MKTNFLMILAACALAACVTPPPSEASACRAEQALYRLRGADATLRILPTPHALNAYSELAARVDFEGETYWFAFSSSLGYSVKYIGRTADPFEAAAREDAGIDSGADRVSPEYDGSELTLFDAAYNVIPHLPDTGGPAPAHILATGIASSIWYSIPRRHLPAALWDFADCVDDLG